MSWFSSKFNTSNPKEKYSFPEGKATPKEVKKLINGLNKYFSNGSAAKWVPELSGNNLGNIYFKGYENITIGGKTAILLIKLLKVRGGKTSEACFPEHEKMIKDIRVSQIVHKIEGYYAIDFKWCFWPSGFNLVPSDIDDEYGLFKNRAVEEWKALKTRAMGEIDKPCVDSNTEGGKRKRKTLKFKRKKRKTKRNKRRKTKRNKRRKTKRRKTRKTKRNKKRRKRKVILKRF